MLTIISLTPSLVTNLIPTDPTYEECVQFLHFTRTQPLIYLFCFQKTDPNLTAAMSNKTSSIHAPPNFFSF